MHFFDYSNSKKKKHGRDSIKETNSKKKKKKGSKKMYETGGVSGYEKKADGTWGPVSGGTTYSFNDCKHEPFKGCVVGGFSLFPTQDKYVTPNMLANFDVVCPLTDFGGGVNYNEFCGVILWIPIKDMTAPDHLRLRANAQRIVELMKAGNTIALWCIGSHGRTGTVLATCIGMCEPDVDPIDAVRERHCKKAVETQSQVEVVFKALGRELPEKWKPAPVAPRVVKSYISEGKAWSSQYTGDALVNGAQPCQHCKSYGTHNDPVHWYGQVRAHTECYNTMQNMARAKANAKETTVVDVSKQLPENAVLGTGGEIVIPMTDELPDDPALISDEAYIEELKKQRPFITKWSQGMQAQVTANKIQNEHDCFGDIICIVCTRLVINPAASEIIKLNEQSFLAHKKCDEWRNDMDTEVLCGNCYLEPAEDDGYCSMTCATIGTFKKAQEKNQPQQENR